MVFYKWEDLRGDNLPFGGQLAKGARGFACNLWNKYPDKFTYGKDPLLAPAKFYWNIVCTEENVNRQPEAPFQGGQCRNVQYRVKLFITYRSGVTETYTSGLYTGPITDIYIASTPNNGNGVWIRYGIQTPQQTSIVRSNVSSNPVTAFTVLEVIRADGLPDNCGSLPGTWRPVLPPPQPGDETWNVDIKEDGDNSLTIPLGWFDIDFSVPLTIKFEVGDVIVDVGGITVNFNLDNDWNVGDNPPPSTFNEDDRETLNDTKETVEDFREVYDENQKPFDREDFDEEEKPETDKEEETDPEIVFVKVVVTTSPIERKTVLNKNVEDTFFWAGYFCWTVDGARTTHVVVQKFSNIYKKPTWADGYVVFAVNGARLQVSTFKRKPKTE